MKIIINVFTAILCLITIVQAQEKKKFTLSGNIEGLKSGSMVYLTTKSSDTLSKTKSKGSKFTFKEHVKGEANFYFIKVDTNINKVGKRVHSNALWLVNDNMDLKGKITDWNNLILIGSEPQDVWLTFKDLQTKNKNILGSKQWDTLKNTFIENHLNSMFTPYLFDILSPESRAIWYSKLGEKAKSSFYGQEAAKQIEMDKKVKEMQLTPLFTNFKITNPDGKVLNVKELVAKSKYTLIDFWASWCGPCRAAIPKLKKTYEDFETKGFNIIGVSTDKKELDWKRL
jgi:thiol-disulfide isomerase/thioredoxin